MNRLRGTIPLSLLAALALVLAGCGGGAVSPSPTETASPEPTETASPEPTEPEEPTVEEEPTESAQPTESEEPTAEEENVRLASSRFDPATLTIAAGTTVVFLNADSYAHTVTEGTGGQAVEDPIVDREVGQNGTVRVTFDAPGTYDITCRFHPSMQLTITVEG